MRFTGETRFRREVASRPSHLSFFFCVRLFLLLSFSTMGPRSQIKWRWLCGHRQPAWLGLCRLSARSHLGETFTALETLADLWELARRVRLTHFLSRPPHSEPWFRYWRVGDASTKVSFFPYFFTWILYKCMFVLLFFCFEVCFNGLFELQRRAVCSLLQKASMLMMFLLVS